MAVPSHVKLSLLSPLSVMFGLSQGFPDAINQPSFPSVVIRPGEQYRHLHVWRFYQYGGESGVRKRGLGRKPVSKVKGPLKRGVGGVKESKRYRPRLDSFESD